jgi:hypothetical protein
MTIEAPEKVFESDVGTWDADVIVRPGPGAPEQRSTGVSVQKLIGGRWLCADFRNEGSGFEGHGIYGWDATRKAYVGTWVDPMRTFLTVMEGAWDPGTRTMTFHAEARLPDGRVLTWREQTVKDGDVQTFRQFWAMPGGEHEMMTVTYRRRA